MIKNFRDHAANERTFLAWVRTAIAIIAFGFVIERFDLLLKTEGLASSVRPQGDQTGNLVGVSSVILGSTIFVLAIIRFAKTANDLDSDDERQGVGSKMDIVLAGLMSLLGISSFFYISHALPELRSKSDVIRFDVGAGTPAALHGFGRDAQSDLSVIKDRVVLLLPGQDVVTGIRALSTPGYTPGHLSFEVVGDDGLVITADAVTSEVVAFENPEWKFGYDVDPDLAIRPGRHRLDRATCDNCYSDFIGDIQASARARMLRMLIASSPRDV